MIKDEIEETELIVIINNKIHDYLYKYHTMPKYLKIPYWIFNCLKRNIGQIKLILDYKTEQFKYMDLIICETISIEKVEEIEVF